MKRNVIVYITGFFTLAGSFSACTKEDPDHWLKDNITIIGKVPVIAGFTVKAPQTTNVAAGSNVKLDLRYWSDDPIDKINLRSTVGTTVQQTVSTTAYQKAYSSVSRTDSLLLSYPVPAGLAVGTAIVMEVEVVNKNTLTKKTTLSLKVQ